MRSFQNPLEEHRSPIIAIKSIGDVIERRLKNLTVLSKEELLKLKEKNI